MSLDKAIKYGKEYRKPYKGSQIFDASCRNHGSCPWCMANRLHKFLVVKERGQAMLDDFLINDSYDAFEEDFEERMSLLKEIAEIEEN